MAAGFTSFNSIMWLPEAKPGVSAGGGFRSFQSFWFGPDGMPGEPPPPGDSGIDIVYQASPWAHGPSIGRSIIGA